MLLVALAIPVTAGTGLLASQPSSAAVGASGFITERQAGFRHAALLYAEAQASDASLDRQVAYRRDGRPVRGGWLFDAFVNLTFTAASGADTAYGNTTAADWLGLLDRWFGRNGSGDSADLHRLDDAISRTAAEIADDGRPMGDPPSKRKVIVTMPWPSPGQQSFGVIDGQHADLGNPADRARVAGWYAREVKAAFAAAGFRHLSLWGIYFMREDAVGPDGEWMAQAIRHIHAEGLRALWIPYWGAPGVAAARQRGMDVVILQPSYAFTSPLDGGRVGAARLESAASFAADHGLGVEIEVRGGAVDPRDRRLLRQYLAAGTRLGYQRAATAWFLGWRPTPFDSMPDGAENPAYSDLARYILGEPAHDDDVHAEAVIGQTPHGDTTATIRFVPNDDLTALRIDFARPARGEKQWVGFVRVEAHTAAGWETAGWAARRFPEPGDETHPAMMVPLRRLAGVDGLRAVFESVGPARPRIESLTGDTSWQLPPDAGPVALDQPARYPDSSTGTEAGLAAGKLTDGRWSEMEWNTGEQVGWQLQSGDVRVTIDLSAVHSVDEIVVYTHAATSAGVTWPLSPIALLSPECAVDRDAAVAPPTCAVTPVPGTNVPLIERPTAGSYGYRLSLTPVQSSPARWVTFIASGHGWLMLDEIEVYAGGRNVAGGAAYHIEPAATR